MARCRVALRLLHDNTLRSWLLRWVGIVSISKQTNRLAPIAISAIVGLCVAAVVAGCTSQPPSAKKISGNITFDKQTLSEPTYEQIESSFKSLAWQDPDQLPKFEIYTGSNNLRITRWFDRDMSNIETFEKSDRMVAVWKHDGQAMQCQLEGVEQGLELVMKIAKRQDISTMLDWFEY